MILSANEFAGKMERPVLYQSKNKGPPVQKRSLLNRVSSCPTGGRGAICDAAFASASPATPSRRPDRVLFEILNKKLSCNEFPALQTVFSDFSTGLQPAFAFRYSAQHEQGPKESMLASILIFDIEAQNFDIEVQSFMHYCYRPGFLCFIVPAFFCFL